MGEETEDEEGRSLANFGPLTRMNMQRRGSAKHADTMSQPWDLLTARYEIQSNKHPNDLEPTLRLTVWPAGWFFNSLSTGVVPPIKMNVWFHIRGPVTLADGAQIRAILNLLK